jgi:hypothetical protein
MNTTSRSSAKRVVEQAVDREQRHRHRGNRHPGVEAVDDLLHDERHADVGDLGGDQEDERDDHAPLVFHHVRRQQPQDAPLVAAQALRRCLAVLTFACHWE